MVRALNGSAWDVFSQGTRWVPDTKICLSWASAVLWWSQFWLVRVARSISAAVWPLGQRAEGMPRRIGNELRLCALTNRRTSGRCERVAMVTNNEQMPDRALKRRPTVSTGQLATAVLLINQVCAVICQFIQHTDPRFPLWYFTVDSAILAGLAAAADLVAPRARWIRVLRHTAAVGVVLSAVIFAAVIAPASPSGTWFQGHDDLPVRVATVLFHAVAPVLVLGCCLLRPTGLRGRVAVAWAFAWPVAYVVALCTMVAVRGSDVIPYPFLAPGLVGWGIVGLAVVTLTALIAAIGGGLGAMNREPRRAALGSSRS